MKSTYRITLLSILAFIFTSVATYLSPVITACEEIHQSLPSTSKTERNPADSNSREPGDFTVVMVGDILLHDGIE